MEYVYHHALFFRKPTRPSLTLRKAPPLISVFFNSLYDPFASPCRGQKPQGRRGNRPTRCRFLESLRLPFQRELHLFPQAPSSSEGGGCNRSYSELKPLRYKVGGPSEVCARFLCGMNRMDMGLLMGCLRLHDICHQRSAPVFVRDGAALLL